jgi:lysophospholipase L1-like esterase
VGGIKVSEINMETEFSRIAQAFSEFTHKHRLASFTELNKFAQKGGVVFVGDSITEGFPIHEMLEYDKPMYNRGISGDTTSGVLIKLKDEIFELEPTKVFLLIGTNDLGQGKEPDEIVRRIEEICLYIKKSLPEVELYIESIYPVNRSEFVNLLPIPIVGIRTNDAIQLMNNAIREIAAKNNLTFIDFYSKLIDDAGQLRKDYSYDGLHLSIKGYEIVKEELQKYL